MGFEVLTQVRVIGVSCRKQSARRRAPNGTERRQELTPSRGGLPRHLPRGVNSSSLPGAVTALSSSSSNVRLLTAPWNSQRCVLVVLECEDTSIMRMRIVTRKLTRSATATEKAAYPGGGLTLGSCPGAPRGKRLPLPLDWLGWGAFNPPPPHPLRAPFPLPALHSSKLPLLNSMACLFVFLVICLSKKNVTSVFVACGFSKD